MAMATRLAARLSVIKVLGGSHGVLAAGGVLDFSPNLFRPVVVYPSLEVVAIIRTQTKRFFVLPQNSFE